MPISFVMRNPYHVRKWMYTNMIPIAPSTAPLTDVGPLTVTAVDKGGGPFAVAVVDESSKAVWLRNCQGGWLTSWLID